MRTAFEPAAKPPRGRTLSEHLTERLRTIGLRLLAGKGADAFRLDDLAKAAGTSKQALYRRWPDKTALVSDLIGTGLTQFPFPVPERANTARDFFMLAEAADAFLRQTDAGRALGRVRHVECYGALRREFENTMRFSIRQILIASPFEAHADLRANLLIGLLWQRSDEALNSTGPLPGGDLETAVFLLLGLPTSAS
ncbi:TetR/AcrR family transcriptional regulator [Roseibium sp. RKSG952]|uniref:TetR/AcrR family transcriptional regulator n=1 Tax=Roseibium sp. RKSG952 TaxID=2529384 RepID=UPI0012BB539B|nr:TetR/AcrR family transcriptional regulator [Roseibium sp. RKSG952]MTH97690.1 TetR/AcrR family transcriptional regulator [Roseibium sp. RKSG952]